MMQEHMHTLPKNITCETSTIVDGNMDFRFSSKKEVIDNRTLYLQKFGIAYQEHIAMRCDHGDIISLVDHTHPSVGAIGQEEQVHSEVLVTQKKHLALMLFTADCQPVSFYDPVTQTIALAHISRKTLLANLSQKTVTFLQEKLSVTPSNLIVHIGPHIKKESYVFPLPLTEESPYLKVYTEEKNGVAHIDLVAANLAQLTATGITLENIFVSPIDTGTSKEHYSYFMMRKKGLPDSARMATILMMR